MFSCRAVEVWGAGELEELLEILARLDASILRDDVACLSIPQGRGEGGVCLTAKMR